MATLKTSSSNIIYKVIAPGTSGLTANDIINSTGKTVNNTFAKLKLQKVAIPSSLAVSGDWTNTQYTNTEVDTTGLTFTVTYSDSTTKVVTDISKSPSTWSSTVGTQTCTFTYTENGASVSCSKEANVSSALSSSPLKFTANTDGSTIILSKVGSPSWSGYYSTDNGVTWNTYTPGTTGTITLTNAGDSVCFKGTYTGNNFENKYLKFSMTGSIAASGNIMSFCSGDNFASVTTIPYNWCFYYLFQSCTSLTTAPELLAITLADYCYYGMFYGCTSLTTAPSLPATTLAGDCYKYMFKGCTSLITAPSLPATTLAGWCYWSMFSGCTSLTTIPSELLATVLTQYCYYLMFYGCTSLTTAPIISATTLAESCCMDMFYGCTALKINNTGSEGTLLFTCPNDTSPTYCVTDMFKNTGGSFTGTPVANGTYYYY